ncbi:MAG: BTAD domain-containing putative transcriptional regulator, partial [Trueperaceae bacterium]|nr:BTAD domain-containing putative transcriptional regulator [Trueperaceae bacterium]
MSRAASGGPSGYVVQVLGPPAVHRDGAPVAIGPRKALALVAHLAVTGAPVGRGALAGLLWPDRDEASARNNLRVALADLKRRAPGLVEARRPDVRLADGVRVDRDAHLAAWLDGPPGPAPDALLAPLLAELGVRDADPFDAWLATAQEAWRATLLGHLDRATRAAEAAGEGALTSSLLEQALEVDPWDEARLARLLDAYVAQGRPAAAVRRFDAFAQALRHEMGIEPDAALAARARAARADAAPVPAHTDPRHPTPRVGQADALAEARTALADPDV